MQNSLYEKVILLALHIKKGRFLVDIVSLNYVLAGAILFDLSQRGKIKLVDKKIVVVDPKYTKDKILDESMQLIFSAKRKYKIRYWIDKIGKRANRFRRIILDKLKDRGVVKLKINTYLWGLIKIKRYPIVIESDILINNEIE